MGKVIVNIMGGLGNQMFQYACGRALSLRTKRKYRIATDQFDGCPMHNGFELTKVFHVDAQEATRDELESLLGWRSHPALRRVLGRPAMNWATCSSWYNEPHFQYCPGIMDIAGSVYLHGYWQSERYFADVEDRIREDLTFCNQWSDEDSAVLLRMRVQPSISVHVRRGDYTLGKNPNIYLACDVAYYKTAIGAIQQRVPNARLFVFSDDPQWVEAYLLPEFGQMEIVKHNQGGRSSNDMRLMSQANHHVISNSSFGWWGAWLNQTVDKIVVAPRQWFKDGTGDQDIVPKSWTRI